MLAVQFQNVPQYLQDENQWILWKLVYRNGREIKMPWSVYDQAASTTDPSTWHSFECAVMRYDEQKHAGIGFVFREGGGFGGIDLDGCRNPQTEVIEGWAWDWINKFHGYTEISPSGTGVKIWIKTDRKITGINRKVNRDMVSTKTPGVEAYTHGRYFAVTGNVIKGYEG